MRISFRQGLVHVPVNFLSLASGQVSLNIPLTDTVVMAFADHTNDYLFTERATVSNAWAGPFNPGTNYWLYWDINVLTGVRTFGHTLYTPIEGATAPASPVLDQHWFDTVNNAMFVWSGTTWVHKIRVFAAQLTAGSLFVSMSISSPIYTGTQIGSLTNIPVDVGALIFDANGSGPIKKADGSFFTTTALALTGSVSSAHVKMSTIIIEAIAQSNIADYSVVRFTAFNEVATATNYLIDNGTYGICEYGTTAGGIVNITLEGLIENPNWDWTAAGVNAPLYVDVNGYLTPTAPPNPIPVAAVVDQHTILLRPSTLFMNTANDPATTTVRGSVLLSVPAAVPANPIVVGDNDPRVTSVVPHIQDGTVHITANQNTFLDALVSYSGGLVAMNNSYQGITRSLQAPLQGLTITNPDGVAGNPIFSLADDLAAIEGLGATGMAIRTGISTWATRALIAPAAGITVTNGDGVAGNPTLVLANDLAAVEGLLTTGLSARIADGVWAARTIVAPAGGISVTNGDGVGGNPTLALTGELGAVEGLATTGVAVRTGTGTWATRTLTAPAAGITITNPDGVVGDPTFALANDLAQIEGLVTTGYAVRQNNNPEVWVTRSITAASGETTVTNGDGNLGNTIIGLPAVGTPVTGSFVKITTDTQGRVSGTTAVLASDIEASLTYTPVNKAGDTMTGALILSGDPIQALGAATKQYVDNLAAGLDPKGSVKAATTGPITLALNQLIDNVAVTSGDRVLVKDQADQTTNGIYVVSSGSNWTRAYDAVPGVDLTSGAFFFVEQGDLYKDSGWVLTTDNPVTNASLLVFQQFSGAGQITAGSGLFKNGNTLSVITPTPGNITITASGIDLTATGITPGVYRSVTVDTYGRITGGTNPTTLGGYGIVDGQPLNANLTAVSAFAGTGFAVRNTGGSWSQRSITGTANQITVTNGGGDGANPSLTLDSTYVQFPGTAGTFVSSGTTLQAVTTINGGLRYDTTLSRMRMVEAGAWEDIGTIRSITFSDPIEGIVHSATPTGSTVNITTTLTNDLQAIEALNTTGIVVRSAADTYTTTTIAGTAGHIVVTNGNGIVGSPTIELAPSGVTPNTFTKVTADAYGRITSGIVAGTAGANTIADYGLTAAVQPLSTNLTNLSAYNTNGIVVYTGGNTFAGRQLVATVGTTANNLTITNPAGQAGDFTFTFGGDLGPFLAAQTSTGFSARTAANTWAQRQIAGTSNRISVTNPTGALGDPTIDIAATYVGQSSITTLGTITTGTWNGVAIDPVHGGTGISSNGTIDQLLSVSHTNSAVWEYKTVNGTTNQVIVTAAAGSLTFSLPQSINTTASVQFGIVDAPVVKSAILTLTDAANIAWDMSLGVHATVTLAGSRTLDNPTNLQAGAVVVLKVVQDAAGGHTLAYGTAFKWTGGTAPVVAAGVNAVSILTFLCDGTNLYEMARSLAIA